MITRERQRSLNEEYADMCQNYPAKGCEKVNARGMAIECPFSKTSECEKAFFYEKGGKDAVIDYSVAVLTEVAEQAKWKYSRDKKVEQWVRLSDVENAINKYLN